VSKSSLAEALGGPYRLISTVRSAVGALHIPSGLINSNSGSAALSWAMPRRRESNHRLRYWTSRGPADMKAEGFRMILVHSVVGMAGHSGSPQLHEVR
jgi:hypothetical protein